MASSAGTQKAGSLPRVRLRLACLPFTCSVAMSFAAGVALSGNTVAGGPVGAAIADPLPLPLADPLPLPLPVGAELAPDPLAAALPEPLPELLAEPLAAPDPLAAALPEPLPEPLAEPLAASASLDLVTVSCSVVSEWNASREERMSCRESPPREKCASSCNLPPLTSSMH